MTQPIYPDENAYRGINAHLQSLLQTPGGVSGGRSRWPSFHAQHVTHIADFLNQQLPARYVAVVEQSLQVRHQRDEVVVAGRSARPDAPIYSAPADEPYTTTPTRTTPVWTYHLAPTLAVPEEDFLPSVGIFAVDADPDDGEPITRLELLSPSNLPGSSHYDAYLKNRQGALLAGSALVEILYLHEYDAPVSQYPRQHPYTILISDPRPSLPQGQIRAYGFAVDEPFAIIPVPLAADETLDFDLGEVYNHTYRVGRWARLVNYADLPPRFDTYSAADQTRIRQRMAAVARQAR